MKTIKKIRFDRNDKPTIEWHEISEASGDASAQYDDNRRKGHIPVHSDFSTAMQRMGIHLCYMLEGMSRDECKTALQAPGVSGFVELSSRFRIVSIEIDGAGDGISVTIKGTKKLLIGKIVKIEGPVTALESDNDATRYYFAEELGDDLDNLTDEATDYLEGKNALSSQTKLELKVA